MDHPVETLLSMIFSVACCCCCCRRCNN